jgi:adenylyltransferase/sulfurtransferase
MLDPKSLEETKQETHRAKSGNGQAAAPASNLDARGLPPGYQFKPDWEITPREVKSMLDRADKFWFVDCRLPNEYQITHIDGTELVPLQQMSQHRDQLEQHRSDKIVVHCKSGGRSMQFTQALRQAGFKDVKSMAGGISLWNKDINPGGPQY